MKKPLIARPAELWEAIDILASDPKKLDALMKTVEHRAGEGTVMGWSHPDYMTFWNKLNPASTIRYTPEGAKDRLQHWVKETPTTFLEEAAQAFTRSNTGELVERESPKQKPVALCRAHTLVGARNYITENAESAAAAGALLGSPVTIIGGIFNPAFGASSFAASVAVGGAVGAAGGITTSAVSHAKVLMSSAAVRCSDTDIQDAFSPPPELTNLRPAPAHTR